MGVQMSDNNLVTRRAISDLEHELEVEKDAIVVAESGPVVAEPQPALHPWPDDVPLQSHGDLRQKPHRLFNIAHWWISRVRPEIRWIPLFKDRHSSENAIKRFPSLLAELEKLWIDELSEPYSIAQTKLLYEADCILIGYHPEKKSIVCYASNRHSCAGEVPDVDVQVTHGGHMAVASGHSMNKIAPLSAAVVALYGHKIVEALQEEIVIVRTNNKYAERILKRAPPTFRSDEMDADALESDPIAIAMNFTHQHVFHFVDELEFGVPLKIRHKLPADARMDGLKEDETVYVGRKSSLAYFLFRVFTHRRAKNPARSTQPAPESPL